MRWRDIKQNRIPEPKTSKKNRKNEKSDVPDYPYATAFERLKAFITDSFLLAMPIFYTVIYLAMGGREGFREHMVGGWAMILIPLGIIVVLFYVVSGQTPGMRAYRLKLIDIKSGKRPTLLPALLRFFYFNLIFFTFFGLFYPLFRKDRRGLQDLLSGTAIVKTEA